jgi:plastocyanin
MRGGRAIVALLAVAAAVGSVLALEGVGTARTARRAKPKVVKVGDNYYDPLEVKVNKGRKVKWQWTPVFQTHNVKLTRAPKGVKKSKFRSQNAGSPAPPFYHFTRRFKKPGKYHFICTLHRFDMQMDVKVRRS